MILGHWQSMLVFYGLCALVHTPAALCDCGHMIQADLYENSTYHRDLRERLRSGVWWGLQVRSRWERPLGPFEEETGGPFNVATRLSFR